jgi:hypothetical protein
MNFSGPCLYRGARNYRLSVAGPFICPSCAGERQKEADAERQRKSEGWREGQRIQPVTSILIQTG